MLRLDIESYEDYVTSFTLRQILNQSLAPQSVNLIYQLLQQIKLLQNLQSNLQMASSMSKAGNGGWNHAFPPQGHIHVQITKTKQTISNLQVSSSVLQRPPVN